MPNRDTSHSHSKKGLESISNRFQICLPGRTNPDHAVSKIHVDYHERNKTMNEQIELITTKQSRASVPRRSRKRAITRADWLVPAGLILLTAIPALGGVLGLVGFATGAALTPDDTQFRALPLPIVLHIVSALPFCLLGAFQFAPGVRRSFPGFHRLSGRLVVPCGLTAGLSGLWMTQFVLFSLPSQSMLL